MEINIGLNIKTARGNKAMTQVQLAEAINSTQSQIAKYERNEQDMTVLRLIEIAQAIGVDPSDLVEPETVINQSGRELNFTAALEYMDDDIREALHLKMAPCKRQDFFTAYEIAHLVEKGEPWELSSKNPQW